MKGFKLDENNDIVISPIHSDIEMTQGADLTRQNMQTVLGTNLGEWFFNLKEGINFRNILGKNKDEDIIRGEVIRGISQVDSKMSLESFSMTLDSKRNAHVVFSAKTGTNEIIEGVGAVWE